MPTKTKKPAARSAEPKEQTPEQEKQARELGQLVQPIFEKLVRELALNESGPGRAARKVLRAERDDKRESVKDLVAPFMMAILKAAPKSRKKDRKTGDYIFVVDIPKEWREHEKADAASSNQ